METTTKGVCEQQRGSSELLCTHTSAFAQVNIPSCAEVFCEALVPVHLSGICIHLHFASFVHAAVPAHALSLCC